MTGGMSARKMLVLKISPENLVRMALQLALTTLESVAVLLNERKRDSEQAAAFHVNIEMLRPP